VSGAPASQRAVIALIDALVDQIEDPAGVAGPGLDPERQEAAIAAAALRKALEATRDGWDEARRQRLERLERAGCEPQARA
jgi:hypothetical protein